MLRTVGSFTTDATGHPVSLPSLEPDSTFVVCHDEEVPAARPMESRQEIIKWIDNCILGDLRTLRLGIDRFHEQPVTPRPLGGCNFLLAAGCCMALEYFGQVYGQGSNATEVVRRYVIDFLRPIDPRYWEIYGVLWSSFRNGIVHCSWPQAICVRGDDSNRIAVGANPRMDGEHLEPAANYAGNSVVISSVRFFSDIERSFDDCFRAWILDDSDDAVLVRAAPRLLEINPGDTVRVREFEVIRGWNERTGKPADA